MKISIRLFSNLSCRMSKRNFIDNSRYHCHFTHFAWIIDGINIQRCIRRKLSDRKAINKKIILHIFPSLFFLFFVLFGIKAVLAKIPKHIFHDRAFIACCCCSFSTSFNFFTLNALLLFNTTNNIFIIQGYFYH